jgi:DNA invertase Pin-like site-specific DNA recombinase
MSDKIQPSHLERRAVVYLRQSDPRQVRNHPESTARQYALRQRAVELGWVADRVEVIDEDLGQSGASTEGRSAFQHLAEDVARGRVGAILALEVSRLARCSADWYRLLDLCGVADVVLIDEQSVYTPRNADDRLLLGLKGAMSEAELTWMRLRLHGGKLNKARRGELHFNAAVGYVWDEGQRNFRLDPDEHVQRAVRLIFERFRIDGSAYAIMRYFLRHGLQMPGCDSKTQELRWEAPRYGTVTHMLHNPVYAGAYVYGRHELRTELIDGQVRRGRVRNRAQHAWTVCLRDHHPAYISWDEFMANQDKLRNNLSPRLADHTGAARRGHALLQGLVLCGKCGHKMIVSYVGRFARARYDCCAPFKYGSSERSLCWMVAARRIDEVVANLFLETVQVPEIELGLAVVREAERQAEEVDRQWKLRLDRARYEAQLAERRYKAVDPDNRVVARTLEREWNDKLRDLDEVERGHQEARRQDKIEITEHDRARILALSKDLRQVWNAATTTHADRKNLLRMLVQQVTLTPIEVPQRMTRIQVLWRTGAVSDFTIPRPRFSSTRTTTEDALEAMRSLADEQRTDAEIAATLNARGFRNVRDEPWRERAIRETRKRHGLPRSRHCPPRVRYPDQRSDGLYSIHGAAARFDVTENSIRYWMKRGWLQPTEGSGQGRACWFELDRATVARLQALKFSHEPSSCPSGPNRPHEGGAS